MIDYTNVEDKIYPNICFFFRHGVAVFSNIAITYWGSHFIRSLEDTLIWTVQPQFLQI